MAPERLQAFTDAIIAKDRPLASFTRMCLSARGLNTGRYTVEDVLSDAYIAAATRIHHDRNLVVNDWVAWFRGFVFLTCLRHMRETIKSHSIDLDSMEAEDRLLDYVADRSSASTQDLRIIVNQALEQALDDEDRKIVQQSADGYTSAEIAQQMGLTAESVRTKKSRALRRLREQLEGISK